MSTTKLVNGQTIIVFDNETKQDMKKILELSQHIFSEPFKENQCQILLDTIIDIQFTYSDDLSDLEDVLRGVIDYLELLQCRLKDTDNTNMDF